MSDFDFDFDFETRFRNGAGFLFDLLVMNSEIR
jgi:hypothetical protein